MTEEERLELSQYAAGMSLAERLEMWEQAAILERHLHVMQHGTPAPLSQHAQAPGSRIVAQFQGARWYQGGPPGLEPGTRLLPAKVTGLDPRSNGQFVPDRETYVHITANRAQAEDFARSYPGGGVVYEVQPVGPVTVLPVQARLAELMVLDVGEGFDLLSIGPSFCCEAATVA